MVGPLGSSLSRGADINDWARKTIGTIVGWGTEDPIIGKVGRKTEVLVIWGTETPVLGNSFGVDEKGWCIGHENWRVG